MPGDLKPCPGGFLIQVLQAKKFQKHLIPGHVQGFIHGKKPERGTCGQGERFSVILAVQIEAEDIIGA